MIGNIMRNYVSQKILYPHIKHGDGSRLRPPLPVFSFRIRDNIIICNHEFDFLVCRETCNAHDLIGMFITISNIEFHIAIENNIMNIPIHIVKAINYAYIELN